MMDSSYELSKRAMELVGGGRIVVTAQFTRSGIETWARAVQPHPRLNIPTNESFPVEELVQMMEKVQAEKHDESAPVRALRSIRSEDPEAPFKDTAEAKKFMYKNGFDKAVRYGVSNILPRESLTWYDLEHDNLYATQARLMYVCSNVGPAKFISRIETQRELLGIDGATNLKEWWDRATALQRFRLTTTAKNVGRRGLQPSAEETYFNDVHTRRLGELRFPFEDPLPVEAPHGSEDEQEGGAAIF